jgi:hypothetical protein
MRRAMVSRPPKKKRQAKPLQEHWRAVAMREFPEHEEFASSDDEEYGIYHLFFQLREEFAEAIASGDTQTASRILGFAGRCLRAELASDGEDIGGAAGVALFEHIFEDTPKRRWPRVFSAMSRRVYFDCRPYVEQCLEANTFSKLDRNAKEFYG